MLPASIHTETEVHWPYTVEQPWGQLWPSGLTRLWLCHTGDYPSDTESQSQTHRHVPAHTHTYTNTSNAQPSVIATNYCTLVLCSTQRLILAESRGGEGCCETAQTDKNLCWKIDFSPLYNLLRTTSVNKGEIDHKKEKKKRARLWNGIKEMARGGSGCFSPHSLCNGCLLGCSWRKMEPWEWGGKMRKGGDGGEGEWGGKWEEG